VGNSSGFERDQSLSRDNRNINSIDIAEGLHRAPCFEFCRLPTAGDWDHEGVVQEKYAPPAGGARQYAGNRIV